jgi:hypothetical protein
MAGAAIAAPTPPTPATTPARTQPPATEVSPVIVPGGPAPKLTASWPKEGEAVSAGVLVLKLTFDRPLAPRLRLKSLTAGGGQAPVCLDQPRRLGDGRTLVILCTAPKATAFSLDLGPGSGLLGADGRGVQGGVLHFRTTSDLVDNLGDALSAAGLSADADPVMGERQIGPTPPPAPPPVSPSSPASS